MYNTILALKLGKKTHLETKTSVSITNKITTHKTYTKHTTHSYQFSLLSVNGFWQTLTLL